MMVPMARSHWPESLQQPVPCGGAGLRLSRSASHSEERENRVRVGRVCLEHRRLKVGAQSLKFSPAVIGHCPSEKRGSPEEKMGTGPAPLDFQRSLPIPT